MVGTGAEATRVPGVGSEDRVVLFDGVCVLCTAWARFLLRVDRAGRFRLGTVQSPQGAAILAHVGLPTDTFDTILLVEGTRVYQRSDAVLRVFGALPAPWRWLRGLARLPAGLRDGCYDVVARNRYRLFGQRAHCVVPSPEEAERFLDGGR